MLHLAFIGCGRVGTTLATTLQSIGHQVLCGLTIRPGSPSAQAFQQVTGVLVLPLESDEAKAAVRQADMLFITTPDKAVTETAQTLTDLGMVHAGQIIVHTSGALGSSALQVAAEQGALILGLHPLQTIASPVAGKSALEGIYCTLEGHPTAVQAGQELVRSWGGIPLTLDAALRPAYHAAAVLASNAVVALAAVATELVGLDDGLPALLPLMHGALRNLENMGLPNALTGPIERGDLATVQAHLQALESNPTALSVYVALGRATVDLALAKGTVSRQVRQSFLSLFAEK